MWREDTTDLPVTALRVLIDRICTPAESDNPGQGQPRPDLLQRPPGRGAAARVRRACSSPLHELIKDIINRGIADGSFRTDIDVDADRRADHADRPWAPCGCRVLGAELNGVPSTPTTSTSSASTRLAASVNPV